MKYILSLLIFLLSASTGSSGAGNDAVITEWQCRGANIKHNNYIDANIDIDMDSLEVLWEREFPEINRCWINNIVSDGERLFVNYYNIIECIDIDTGEEIWSNSYGVSKSVYEVPNLSVFGDTLYYTGNQNLRLFSISKTNGEINWMFDRPNPEEFGWLSAPVAVEDKVLCNSGFSIVCIDAKDGRMLWQSRDAIASEYSTPVILGNRVFVANSTSLYTASLLSGSLINTQPTGAWEELQNQPRVYGDDIIVLTACGYKQYDGVTGELVKYYRLDDKCKQKTYERPGSANSDKYKVIINNLYDAYTCFDDNDVVKWHYKAKPVSSYVGPTIIGNFIYFPEKEEISIEQSVFRITKLDLESGDVVSQKDVITVNNEPDSENISKRFRGFQYFIFASGKFFFLSNYTIFCVGMP